MDETEQRATLRSALNSKGSFKCLGFGYNGFTQLSAHKSVGKDNATTQPSSSVVPSPVPLDVDCVSSIAASWSCSFYLKENGTVSSMGWISRTKEVGKGLNLLPDHFVTDVCCSWTQLAFLTNDGDCLLWSNYANGASKPVQVKCDGTKFKAVGCRELSCVLVTGTGQAGFIANEQDQDGNDTKPVLVFRPIDIATQMASVACGKEHTLLLSSLGVIYSLGCGSRGQLGRGLLVEEQGPEIVPALEGIRIQFVAAGGWHSAAISEFGDLYMWGWNEKGQLGLGVNHDGNDGQSSSGQVQCQTVPVPINFPDDLEVMTVSCGTRHTAAVTGDLVTRPGDREIRSVSWRGGTDVLHQLFRINSKRNHKPSVRRIMLRIGFTGDGSVWTWGWGYYGQLGHGDREDRPTPTQVAALSSMKLQPKTLCCGAWSTFVITAK